MTRLTKRRRYQASPAVEEELLRCLVTYVHEGLRALSALTRDHVIAPRVQIIET
jgi:hypothetical protein